MPLTCHSLIVFWYIYLTKSIFLPTFYTEFLWLVLCNSFWKIANNCLISTTRRLSSKYTNVYISNWFIIWKYSPIQKSFTILLDYDGLYPQSLRKAVSSFQHKDTKEKHIYIHTLPKSILKPLITVVNELKCFTMKTYGKTGQHMNFYLGSWRWLSGLRSLALKTFFREGFFMFIIPAPTWWHTTPVPGNQTSSGPCRLCMNV